MTFPLRHRTRRIVRAAGPAVAACAAVLAPVPAAPAGAAQPDVLLGGPKVLLVLHPGSGPPGAPTVFQRLVERESLSIGLLGATQGPYSVRQTFLDMSQGARVSRSGYEPRELPRLRLAPATGGGWRIAGWEQAVERARRAPGDLVPGLLAGAAPGGAGYVSTELPPRSHVEAVVAADRRGRVADASLGAAHDVAARARSVLRRRSFVVVALPPGPTGDRQLDALLGARGAGEVLIVLGSPPRSRSPQMLPVGAAGLSAETGLLRSGTTRRGGLVTAIDVAPTVLAHLERPVPGAVAGRPIAVAPGRDVGHLRRLERRLRVVSPRRYPTLVAVAGSVAALALALMALGGRSGARRAGRLSGLAALWVPALALVAARLEPSRQAEMVLMAGGAILLAALTDRLVPWPRGPAVPALGGVVAYVIDLALGSPLIVRSLLGPNPRFGARFYGIGNELEATLPVLLLVGLAAAAGATARSRRLALAFGAAMLVLGVAVGAGRLGADVGGVISIGAGGAAAVLLALPGPPSRRALAIACGVPVAALAALAAIDLLTGGDAHFTGTVLGADDAGALVDVVRRRTALAVDTLLRGLMPLFAALSVAALVVGWRRRRRLLAPVAGRPAWPAALGGGAVAGIAGTLANDSGPMLLVFTVVILALATAYIRGAPGDALAPRL